MILLFVLLDGHQCKQHLEDYNSHMTEISNADTIDTRKESQEKKKKQTKNEYTEKRALQKKYLSANIGLIRCCSMHHEVPKT